MVTRVNCEWPDNAWALRDSGRTEHTASVPVLAHAVLSRCLYQTPCHQTQRAVADSAPTQSCPGESWVPRWYQSLDAQTFCLEFRKAGSTEKCGHCQEPLAETKHAAPMYPPLFKSTPTSVPYPLCPLPATPTIPLAQSWTPRWVATWRLSPPTIQPILHPHPSPLSLWF